MNKKALTQTGILVLLVSALLWAGDPWKDKPYTAWSEKEVERILSDSPWAKKIEGYPAEKAPRELYAKGNYYSLNKKNPFKRLIYPVPEPGGLGVHLTLDLAGQARFGPDVEWVQRIAYDVDPQRGERFYAAIRRYWPGLPDGALLPGYSGIRPKTAGPGEPASDFQIQGPRAHGVPGLVNLFGIESPGLTASLALAEAVLREVG